MNAPERAIALVAEDKDEYWIRIIEEWRESGQSIAEWVRERGEFSYSQFIGARRRLFPDEIQSSDFMEKEATWSAISMEIPPSSIDIHVNDCRIVVKPGFDQELLREVVEVLKDAN